MPEKRQIGLHVFCSVKGGVGKSTLAVACAHLLAEAASPCVVIDADLTGTSLADGLLLEAPILAQHEDGTLDLDAPPQEPRRFYDAEQTRRLRLARVAMEDDKLRGVPFFNDVLLHMDEEDLTHVGRVDAALWRPAGHPPTGVEVRFLPSSPTRRDVAHSLGWLYRIDNPLLWLRRVSWVIDELVRRIPSLRDVVIDLPPGLAGFSHEILLLVDNLAARKPMPPGYPSWEDLEFRVNPLLVMTQDSNDLFAALEYYQESRRYVPDLRPVVNGATEAPESIKRRVREHFQGAQVYDGIEENLLWVGRLGKTLGRLFIDGALHVDDGMRRLRTSLLLGGQ